jgi:hypothetical protein
MSESMSSFIMRTPSGTVEEVLEDYRQNYHRHGSDLDLLAQSMMLIQAGHYREGMKFALQACSPSPIIEEPPEVVDKAAAQATFLAGAERARPLYEQAALEIEGKVEGSQTMGAYFEVLAMLKNDPNW